MSISRHDEESIHRLRLPPPRAPPVQVLPTLPFRSLQELNLDNNSLVNFAALGGLRSLGVLRLSYNKIDSVRPHVLDEVPLTDDPSFSVRVASTPHSSTRTRAALRIADVRDIVLCFVYRQSLSTENNARNNRCASFSMLYPMVNFSFARVANSNITSFTISPLTLFC